MSDIGSQLNRPLVLRGAALAWNAVQRWSPEYLERMVGNATADVIVSDTGVVQVTPFPREGEGTQFNIPQVTVREAVEWILDGEKGGPKAYISEQSVKERFPMLLEELSLPEIDGSLINLWFGSSKTLTPLHHDEYHNIFVQVYGEKTFTLFDPCYTDCVYPYTNDPNLRFISQVNVTRPNLAAFPRFSEALPFEVELSPGDVLFVPVFWWHYVFAKTTSISVSQWWAPGGSDDDVASAALRRFAETAGRVVAG